MHMHSKLCITVSFLFLTIFSLKQVPLFLSQNSICMHLYPFLDLFLHKRREHVPRHLEYWAVVVVVKRLPPSWPRTLKEIFFSTTENWPFREKGVNIHLKKFSEVFLLFMRQFYP